MEDIRNYGGAVRSCSENVEETRFEELIHLEIYNNDSDFTEGITGNGVNVCDNQPLFPFETCNTADSAQFRNNKANCSINSETIQHETDDTVHGISVTETIITGQTKDTEYVKKLYKEEIIDNKINYTGITMEIPKVNKRDHSVSIPYANDAAIEPSVKGKSEMEGLVLFSLNNDGCDSIDTVHLNYEAVTGDQTNIEQTAEQTTHIIEERIMDLDHQPYICDTCNKEYATLRKLKKHIKQKHLSAVEEYKCPYCPAVHTTVSGRNSHIRLHTGEKPYRCEFCESTFRTHYFLHQHLTKYCKPETHLCEICGRVFRRKRHLRRHRIIHTGERKKECNFCGKKFKVTGEVSRHVRRCHRKLSCDVCLKVCNGKRELIKHKTIHLNRPYKCDQCDASFDQNTNLTKHKILHTGLKPYQCNYCKKAYAHKSNLNKHFKAEHGFM